MKTPKTQELAVEIERKYGTDELLKLSFGTLMRVLVKKKICTEEELQNTFIDEANILKQNRE